MTHLYSEVSIDASLVMSLIATQFPLWAGLPLVAVKSAGTDNAIFRLGNDMVVRLPKRDRAAADVQKEYQCLPRLAPFLPLAIPTPLVIGLPGEGYPWHWSIYHWLDGESAIHERIFDLHQASTAMADFITALQKIDSTGGPLCGSNNDRGVPLAVRDIETREAIETLGNVFDAKILTVAWEVALQAPVWQGKPVLLHGDLHPGNLLVHHGKLSAVIDFGLFVAGDPACDLMVGWTLLSAETRTTFRAALSVDDATWERGRGWALSFGVVALAYYLDKNLELAGIARRTINEVVVDFHR